MCQYIRAQVCQWASTSVSKYFSAQVLQCASTSVVSTSVRKYVSAQVRQCASTSVRKYISAQVHQCANTSVLTYLSPHVCQHSSLPVCKYMSTRRMAIGLVFKHEPRFFKGKESQHQLCKPEGVSSCPDGYFLCGSQNCIDDTPDNRNTYRSCGDLCVTIFDQCDGRCTEGFKISSECSCAPIDTGKVIRIFTQIYRCIHVLLSGVQKKTVPQKWRKNAQNNEDDLVES